MPVRPPPGSRSTQPVSGPRPAVRSAAPPPTPRIRRAPQPGSAGAGPRAGLRFPASGYTSPLELLGLAGLAGALLLGLALRTLGDSWWPVTAILFAGRWPWTLLAAALVLVTPGPPPLAGGRAAAAALGAGALLFVMGATLGLGRWFGGGDPASRIRLVTFNVDGRAMTAGALMDLVSRYEPDVLVVQECGEGVIEAVTKFSPPTSSTGPRSASPVPLSDRLDADPAAAGHRTDRCSGQVIRYRIEGPAGPFTLVNLHLETPRDGLEALLGRSARAPDLIDKETVLRDIESSRARAWADSAPPPTIVAGDFNTPKESVIFRRHWGDLTEGLRPRRLRLRSLEIHQPVRPIDHVLTDEHWVGTGRDPSRLRFGSPARAGGAGTEAALGNGVRDRHLRLRRQPLGPADDHHVARGDALENLDPSRLPNAELDRPPLRGVAREHPDHVAGRQLEHRLFRHHDRVGPAGRLEPGLDEHARLKHPAGIRNHGFHVDGLRRELDPGSTKSTVPTKSRAAGRHPEAHLLAHLEPLGAAAWYLNEARCGLTVCRVISRVFWET
ncbi:MAG: endonuclease/exonuclease/phosphatase family protein [Gemmatimonadales bacterium]